MGKIKTFFRNKWVGFTLASILYILWFVLWTGNWWLLLGEIVIFDLYITRYFYKYVWRHNAEMCKKSKSYKAVYEWVNAIIFATVVASLVHIFFFQMYVIPSSSMEKSLLVGGLSLRQQGSLRSPDAQYPGGISVRTPYDAFFENQKIVLRKRQMALSPPQGTGPNRAQRRSGIQLSGRRYGAARTTGRFVLRRTAAISANFRTSGRPRTADAGIHGHHAPGGQA